METLRYGSGKILTAMIFCGVAAAGLLYVLVYPEAVRGIPRLWVLATSTGHYAVTPILVLLCLAVVWRGALMLAGDMKAVEATSTHLVLATWWRTRRIAWSDVGHAAITSYGSARYKTFQLVVHYRSEGPFGTSTVKVPLSTTELHRNRYDDFAATLNGLIAQNGARSSLRPEPVAAAVREAPMAEGPGFDPDAALARYMEKKARGLIEAPGPAPAVRQGFGRKGL